MGAVTAALCFLYLSLQVYEGLKPSDKFEKTLDYRCIFRLASLARVSDMSRMNMTLKSTLFRLGLSDGRLGMTSGGSVSSSQRESLIREVDFGTAWQTCLRNFAPARLSVPCLCRSSAARPTR